MRTKNYLLFLVLVALFPIVSQAQTKENAKAQQTHAEYLGKTSAIKDLVPLGPISKTKKQGWKKQNKIPKNFLGRGISKVTRPELEHQGPDKLRQGIPAGTKSTDLNLLVNIDGITAGTPNDPSGDIGKDHYMLAVNATTIAIYDKAGTEITTFNANTLWQEIGFSSAGDPIILYDEIEDRWLITEFPSGNQLLVAISETSDPTGAYDVYNFQTPNFPDYPKYGIWKDAITVTTNEQGTSNLTIYMINKSQLYGSKPQVDIQRMNLPGANSTEAGFFVATPVDWMGKNAPVSEDPIFLAIEDSSWGQVDEDQVSIFTVDVDWFNPANTTFSKSGIVTTPFDSYPCSAETGGFACVPQPNGNGLDAIPEVVMNQAVYRNFGDYEAMVFNFITDVTDGQDLSGIRWMEMRNTGNGWFIYQEGTFSPDDGLDRYMAGIALDASGNIGMGYNVSSENEFVGVRYTGRKHDDELGIMTIPEQIAVEGTATINSFGRFGDYAQMGVDPVNGKTFWFVTEYASSPQSKTRIVAFEIDRDASDIGVHKIISETSAAFDTDETFTVQINNYGLEDASGFTIGYIFEGGTPVIETFDGTIPAGESAEYTFDATVDFVGGGGIYNLQTFTSYDADQLIVNDSMWTQLNKLVALDLGPGSLTLPNASCDTALNGSLVIFNFGADEITSATIEIYVDGDLFLTENWEGSLNFCESETITFPLSGLAVGDHDVEVIVSQPNGMDDQNLTNDTIEGSFSVFADLITTTLTLLTDSYPNETTWEITDGNGDVIFSGGPYNIPNNEEIEVFCLPIDDCFTFTLFDSFGDGLFVPGTYTITSGLGQTYASLMNNEFGTQESNSFCADASCVLTATVTTTAEGDNGGSILLTPTSGVGPFTYSIDGGENFQDSGLFENLPAGTYDIVINGAEECTFTGQAEVEVCALQIIVNIDNVEGDIKGAILFEASGGNGPYEYSIDGGATWQNNPLFDELDAGDYEISVRDADGCIFTDSVTIEMTISTTSEVYGTILIATPNPTNGLFKIYLEGAIEGSTFINYEIYDSAGKSIRHSKLVKYDDYYTAQVTLVHEPAGVYYVRVINKSLNKMVKVIKL